MINNAECTICTYINPDEGQDTKFNSLETFYNGHDGQVAICLCRSHSLELFRSGQVRFLSKYWPMAKKYEEKGDRDFFKIMKVAIARNSTARAA
jgi:hypothetical protein